MAKIVRFDSSKYQPYKATYRGGRTAQQEIEAQMPKEKPSKKDKKEKGSGGGKLSFNHKAYKKYNSSKSLAEKILKSNSEGNRFIMNADL